MTDDSTPDPATGVPTARAPRQSVFLSTTLERFGSLEATQHRVRDLSPEGMRIDQAAALPLGSTVLVSVGSLEAVGATVMWAKEGWAGLKFATPIDPDKARVKAAVPPKSVAAAPRPASNRAPTAGWIRDLNNPYRS